MKKTILLITILLGLNACASGPLMVTNANVPIAELKEGKACSNYLLGFIPLGVNNSTLEAKKDGNITQIATVDITSSWWLLGTSKCTVVSGK